VRIRFRSEFTFEILIILPKRFGDHHGIYGVTVRDREMGAVVKVIRACEFPVRVAL
jgi:hypothetical protein